MTDETNDPVSEAESARTAALTKMMTAKWAAYFASKIEAEMTDAGKAEPRGTPILDDRNVDLLNKLFGGENLTEDEIATLERLREPYTPDMSVLIDAVREPDADGEEIIPLREVPVLPHTTDITPTDIQADKIADNSFKINGDSVIIAKVNNAHTIASTMSNAFGELHARVNRLECLSLVAIVSDVVLVGLLAVSLWK